MRGNEDAVPRRRIVVIHRYFWPDSPPYATLLRGIVERWDQAGHEVSVLSAQPSYKRLSKASRRPRSELLAGVRVLRLPVVPPGRIANLANMAVFPVVVSARLLSMRGIDLVMCSTVPQVTLGLTTSLMARLRGVRFVYHCMDLHPEIGRLSGEFGNPLVFRCLMWMDTAAMRSAWRVIVLSDDMRQAVIRRDPALADKVRVINNFPLADSDPAPGVIDPVDPVAEGIRIVFTGNLGRFQGLEGFLLDVAAVTTAAAPVEVVFMGEGRALSGLRALAQNLPPDEGLRVRFLPHASVAEARALMRSADLGLVSLAPEVVRYAYPSKTATYLAERLPLLVLCEQDSELARSVSEGGLGFSVKPGDRDALRHAIGRAATAPAKQRAEWRRNIDLHLREHLTEESVLAQWSALIGELNVEEGDT